MQRDYPYPANVGSSLLVVTDLHLGRRTWTGAQLETAGRDIDFLEQFVDGVAIGGDLIHWGNAAAPEDAQWKAWFASRGKQVPWVRVAGNHDLASFASPLPSRSAAQWLTAIGETNHNQSRDLGSTRVIAVSPDTWANPDWDAGMQLSKATLDWLENELASSTKPAWLVGHNPLPQQYPGHIAPTTATRLEQIIANSGNVLAWVSGHRHADIRTDVGHAVAISVGGRRVAAINAPPAGGQVNQTTVDPWDSPLHAMVLTYEPGRVTCRWRNLLTRSWDIHQGARLKHLSIDR